MRIRKGISPVVATALLIVVSVVAVVGFQNWYKSYESILLSDTEQKSSNTGGVIDIEYVSSDGTIYIKNSGNDNISIKEINIGENNCFSNQILEPGVNNFSLDSCLGSEEISNVIIITDSGIVEEKIFTGDVEVPLVVVLSSSLNCSTDLDGDSYINFTCALYPMTETNYEGDLDPTDIESTIQPDMDCLFKGNKSGCESNFVLGGCDIDANGINDTVLDIASGLCWQRKTGVAARSWSDAKSYCSVSNLGGHSDWRLPSKQEMISILDISRKEPAVVGGNTIFNTTGGAFSWTSTTMASSTTAAWEIDLWLGKTNGGQGKGSWSWTVCVRS